MCLQIAFQTSQGTHLSETKERMEISEWLTCWRSGEKVTHECTQQANTEFSIVPGRRLLCTTCSVSCITDDNGFCTTRPRQRVDAKVSNCCNQTRFALSCSFDEPLLNFTGGLSKLNALLSKWRWVWMTEVETIKIVNVIDVFLASYVKNRWIVFLRQTNDIIWRKLGTTCV